MDVIRTLGDTQGLDWSRSGGTGTAIVAELWYVRGGDAPGLPGHYKLGGWYQTISALASSPLPLQPPSPPSPPTSSPVAFSRRLAASGGAKAGAYALVDQAGTEGMPA